MAQPAVRTIEELCDAWALADDSDEAGELADELAQRALDLGENETAAARCVCEAICARLRRGGDEEDDEEMTVGETAARAELKAEADAAAVGKLTVPKLKEALLQRGLEATGLKAVLAARLLEALGSE